MNEFYELIGEGADKLTPLQMGIRAAIIFVVALALIRFTGRRAFGQRSTFDTVISILLGAILSRSVVVADVSFFAPIAAAFVICFLHFIFALISTYSHGFGRLVKGDAKVLFKDGKRNEKNMRNAFISEKDLQAGIRKEGKVEDETKIKEAWLERDGSISVVKEE